MEETPSQDVPVETPQTDWTTWAAGFMLIAGILHLLVVPVHLEHARGIGLFFILLGGAQIVWALAYFRAPSPRLGTIGLAFLIGAPVLLWIVTRIVRSPWSTGPEQVDIIGVVTQLAAIAAAIPLFRHWEPSVPSGSTVTVVVMAFGLGMGGYAGAIGAETIDWLGEGEAPHIHGAGAHDDHEGHETVGFGIRGQSMVGTVPYLGPVTGIEIRDQCATSGLPAYDCWAGVLKDILVAKGSVFAFDVLEELMAADAQANADSHAIAHDLGRFAYQAYGYDVGLTLGECSYDVFQGCLHGALQYYFDDIAATGGTLDQPTLRATCSQSESEFEIYACLHGVGHGVMLYTNYKLHESLDMCALLDGWFAQESCYGGVWMENVVGYADSLNPTAAGGHQGHGGHTEPPTFWVDPEVPEYPCNIVASQYGDSCWRMQTSLILRFNNGNFAHGAEVCETKAGNFRLACFNSLGRDAAPYTARDPMRMSQHCTYGNADDQWACVEGFSAGEVLQENDPNAGYALCGKILAQHREACYHEVGQQAARMWDESRARALCSQVPAFEDACLRGARLD